MKTPEALADRTSARCTRKGVLVVLGQERRGLVAKWYFAPTTFTIAGNARLKEILHVIGQRGCRNPRRQPNRPNEVAAAQVNNTLVIDPLLRFDV